jgi:acyl-CoA reductase-like NAD-dependent aldehyde dehydrogenase
MQANGAGAYERRALQFADREWSLLIAGKPAGAAGGPTYELESPYTGQVVARAPDAASPDVQLALASAEEASRAWRHGPPWSGRG